MNILVVEDDENFALLAVKILERRGHEVSVAPTGAEARALAASSTYDVVLLDLRLPDANGYDIATELKAAGTAHAIVACSAHVMQEDRDRARKAGCDAFLGKPYGMTDLVSAVEAYR